MSTKRGPMEINLLTLMEVLFKKIAVILAAGIIFGLLAFGWAYSDSEPVERYTATLSVFVTSEAKNTNINYDISYPLSPSTVKDLTNTCAYALKSVSMLNDILKETALPYSVSELSKMIGTTVVTDISALDINVKAADPHEVELITQAILELLPQRLKDLVGDISINITDYSISAVRKITEGGLSWKKVVIGVLWGVFLAAAVIVVKFLLSGQVIWRASELDGFYPKLPLLATIPQKTRRGKHKSARINEEYRFAAANITMLADESCFAIGLTGVKDISCETAEKIADAFTSFGKKVRFVDAKSLSCHEIEENIKGTRADYDYVIFELPSIGSKADAVPAAKLMDEVVIVIKEQVCTIAEIDTCIERLGYTGTKLLGFVAE